VAEPPLEPEEPEEPEEPDEPDEPELEFEPEPHAATPMEAATTSATALMRLIVNVFSFLPWCARSLGN
jgi:hypothetical protein